MKEITIGVRHLADQNRLRSDLLDSPLEPGQEPRAQAIACRIRECAERLGQSRIKFLHSEQQRSRETGALIAQSLGPGFSTSMLVEPGLCELEQGMPVLPPDFQDGDTLPALDRAWKVFCRQTFDLDNIDYHFGSGELAPHFVHQGECVRQVLPRQYTFFGRLFAGQMSAADELLVLLCHGTTLHTLAELQEIAAGLNDGTIPDFAPLQLPRWCWQIYKERKGKTFPAKWDYGETLEFDWAHINASPLPAKIAQALRLVQMQPASTTA